MRIEYVFIWAFLLIAKLHASSPISNSTKAFDRFIKFLDDVNFQVRKVQPRYVNASRIGIVASEAIRKDDIFFYLNKENNAINENTYKNTPLSKFTSNIEAIKPFDINLNKIILDLMYEKLQPESYWKPYLDIIPTNYSNFPYYYEDEVLQLIKETDLYELIVNQKNDFISNWESMQKEFFSKKKKSFNSTLYTFDLYLWATLTAYSRSYWIWGKRYLIPSFDMIGCCGDTFKQKPQEIEWNKGQDAWFRSPGEYNKGDEIQINFGKPNWFYLLNKGMLVEDNAQDCIQIKFQILNETDKEFQFKSQFISKKLLLPINDTIYQNHCFGNIGYLDKKLTQTIGMALMNKAKLESGESYDQKLAYTEILRQLVIKKKLFDENLTYNISNSEITKRPTYLTAIKYRTEYEKNLKLVLSKYEQAISYTPNKQDETKKINDL